VPLVPCMPSHAQEQLCARVACSCHSGANLEPNCACAGVTSDVPRIRQTMDEFSHPALLLVDGEGPSAFLGPGTGSVRYSTCSNGGTGSARQHAC